MLLKHFFVIKGNYVRKNALQLPQFDSKERGLA